MELTKDFKDALQTRTKAMQEQDARRSKYSRASPTAYQPIGNYDPELGGHRSRLPHYMLMVSSITFSRFCKGATKDTAPRGRPPAEFDGEG